MKKSLFKRLCARYPDTIWNLSVTFLMPFIEPINYFCELWANGGSSANNITKHNLAELKNAWANWRLWLFKK